MTRLQQLDKDIMLVSVTKTIEETEAIQLQTFPCRLRLWKEWKDCTSTRASTFEGRVGVASLLVACLTVCLTVPCMVDILAFSAQLQLHVGARRYSARVRT